MSSMWTKSAVFAASAALLSLAVVPALAQPEEAGAQSPPSEMQEVQPGAERVSRPEYEQGTDRALKLRAREKMAGRKCRSGADTEAEAVEDCTSQLNCPAGTAVKCQYRSNNQDWICSCK